MAACVSSPSPSNQEIRRNAGSIADRNIQARDCGCNANGILHARLIHCSTRMRGANLLNIRASRGVPVAVCSMGNRSKNARSCSMQLTPRGPTGVKRSCLRRRGPLHESMQTRSRCRPITRRVSRHDPVSRRTARKRPWSPDRGKCLSAATDARVDSDECRVDSAMSVLIPPMYGEESQTRLSIQSDKSTQHDFQLQTRVSTTYLAESRLGGHGLGITPFSF